MEKITIKVRSVKSADSSKWIGEYWRENKWNTVLRDNKPVLYDSSEEAQSGAESEGMRIGTQKFLRQVFGQLN